VSKFYVGQLVRIKSTAIPVPSWASVYKGQKTTIIGINGEWYQLDLTKGAEAKASALEPVYDGDQKSHWSECVWQPTKETA
jgi:hypothetical protein